MTGREPMNPRGHQYALAGTLPGWTRLEQPTQRQLRLLRRSYHGWSPRVYSRYGVRQWAGVWPGTRIVVKDPFAMLSLPRLAEVTRAKPILLYRHPGAILASYRRMGWRADADEIRALLQVARRGGSHDPALGGDQESDTDAMAYFWSTLHALALHDLESLPAAIVVSHEELAQAGQPALRALYDHCDLQWTGHVGLALTGQRGDAATQSPANRLHDFDRAPHEVAQAWRARLSEREIDALESATQEVRQQLDERRIPLLADRSDSP
jgi:hypothetical protein